MRMQPRIVVAGILDTKGPEIQFIAGRIQASGGKPIVLELSLKREVGWADISLTALLSRQGLGPSELAALGRIEASKIVVAAAIEAIREMRLQGRMDGIIALGGSTGTSMATRIMHTLPVGVPKLMLSTMASGDVSSYAGTRHIAMLYPIAETD